MKQAETFQILDRVDSTNNYAMGALHAGLAKHGSAWFAHEQTAGKGQRGKAWNSAPGENIIMSISVKPEAVFTANPFLFNMQVANSCREFLELEFKVEIKVKWPNDLFARDRKAGGILIENVYRGSNWQWAIVGIGININQSGFSEDLKNAVSIANITGEQHDPVEKARKLREFLLAAIAEAALNSPDEILGKYNNHLYKQGKKARFRKGNMIFQTTINSVDAQGRLHTSDAIDREFGFGEIEWML